MNLPRPTWIRPGRWIEPMAWGFLFALAHGQLPLYSGNQNSYLLHAVARVEPSGLAQDWFADTLDPFPLFTGLSAALMRISPAALQIAYALVLLAYGAALWTLVRTATPASTWRGRTVGMAILTLLHSVQLIFLARENRDPWTPEFWTNGLAGQYALGPVWQPCVFGALLVAAVALAAKKQYRTALACAVAAQALHASYLLGAASLVAGIAWAAWAEGQGAGRAFRLLAVGGAAMLPFVAFNLLRFQPTDPNLFAASQNILFSERIPQHANPAVWWTGLAWLKIGLIAAGLACGWRNQPLRRVLLLPAVLGLILSLIAGVCRIPSLSLLFPWRVSVWLVPVSLSLVAGWGVERLSRWPAGRTVLAVASVAGTSACLLAAALGVMGFRQLQSLRDPLYQEAIAAVHARLKSGEVLLIPPHLEEFRMDARVPIWIDRKTHPYRDAEILDWKARLEAAYAWYRGEPRRLESMDPAGAVSWVLLDSRTAGAPLPATTQCVFSNADYRLIRWSRSPP